MPEPGSTKRENRYFYVESLKGNPLDWSRIKEEVLPLYRTVAEKLLPQSWQLHQDALTQDLQEPTTNAVLLRLKADKRLVGFSYAKPDFLNTTTLPVRLQEASSLGPEVKVTTLIPKTAQVCWTEIHPDYRQKGGWTMMMDELDRSLIEDGRYDSMVRTARIREGYDKKVKRRYQGRVRFEKRLRGYDNSGPLLYMRISLT